MPSPSRPLLRTRLPGPRARAILKTDAKYLSPSYTRSYPFVAARGRGCWVEDVDGNRFLDFAAGIAVLATGHCHPRIVGAVKRQAGQLMHIGGTDFYYRLQADLAEAVCAIAPGKSPKRAFLTNSGTESIEAAIKLARYATGRPNFLAFLGAFHGRSLGALSLTASRARQREKFSPLLPGVVHVPYADPFRSPLAGADADCAAATLRYIEKEVFTRIAPPGDIAAIVVEPIQGEGGYVVPPHGFLPGLARLARKHGILLVLDEIQSGMGRTGRMFACEHDGVVPDILCIAKGIASGLPLGAIVAPASIMRWPRGTHANTFGGNPLACAAALETIRLLRGGLIDNARRMGERLRSRLEEIAEESPRLGQVRGQGLMIGADFVTEPGSREPDGVLADRVVEASFRRGLLLLTAGPSTVRFCPPLVIRSGEVDLGASIFREAVRAAVSGRR